ncbi:MAG TPA: S41 family peptidase [Bdellovibrionota bacterium]|nr:S41 family peptidase [Bdellovibrionota bacterium]
MKSFSKFAVLSLLLTSCLFAQPKGDKAAAPSPARSKSQMTCVMAPHIMRMFLLQHMTEKSITPEIQRRTVKSFLESLDGMKLYLTKSEYKSLDEKLTKMFKGMGRGDCSALEDARTIVEQRSKEHYNYMQKLLGDSFKFDETVELVTDPKKRDFAATNEDINKFLNKYVHVQIVRYLAADKDLKESKELLLKSYMRNSNKVRELAMADLLDLFINSFSSSLDPHSNYLPPKADEEFDIGMTNSLEGIGASLTWQDGFTVVNEVIKGGPADRAKVLTREDRILAVAQGNKGEYVPIVDMDLSDVVRLIRGKKGSTVKLRVQRKVDGVNTNLEVAIVRDKVAVQEQMARIKYEERERNGKKLNLGVITLPSFYSGERGANRSAYNDVKRLLAEAKEKKVDGLMLDLSNNGGGLLTDAVSIAGLFLKEGEVVASKFTGGEVEKLKDEDSSTDYSGPLVLLINRYSASASEIVAGALKDYNRALIVGGDHTFGKGTVQSLAQLPEGLGALKFTISMFYLPSGDSTQHKGVDSDIVIPSVLNSDDIGEKAMDYSIPPSSIKSFLGKNVNVASGKPDHWNPVKSAWVKSLAAKSSERVKSKEEFKEIFKDIEIAKDKNETIKVKEFLARSKEIEKKDKKDLSKRQIELIEELGRPYVNEGLDILADLVEVEKK